jgi:hypothetical protein
MFVTPRKKVFQKLTVIQLVKKFHLLFWNPKLHYHVYMNPLLVLILSHLDPI